MSRIWCVTFVACIIQGAFSQAIYGNGLNNNGVGYNGLASSPLEANTIANTWPINNVNPVYTANSISGYPLTPNAGILQNSGVPTNAVPLSGMTSSCAPLSELTPIGVGDVAVTGEMPVGGSTAVSGNVPVIGYVTFEGYLPAGGMVTVASNCACNGDVLT